MKKSVKRPFCYATANATIKALRKMGFLKGGMITKKAKCPLCSQLGYTCSTCGGHRH